MSRRLEQISERALELGRNYINKLHSYFSPYPDYDKVLLPYHDNPPTIDQAFKMIERVCEFETWIAKFPTSNTGNNSEVVSEGRIFRGPTRIEFYLEDLKTGTRKHFLYTLLDSHFWVKRDEKTRKTEITKS